MSQIRLSDHRTAESNHELTKFYLHINTICGVDICGVEIGKSLRYGRAYSVAIS
jgi:hypothetical protein